MKTSLLNKLLVSSVLACAVVASSFGEAARPASPVLGYQIDISRSKVPTMETLYRIVDILADLGYNQFQLYTFSLASGRSMSMSAATRPSS